jgi:hypothetical protein
VARWSLPRTTGSTWPVAVTRRSARGREALLWSRREDPVAGQPTPAPTAAATEVQGPRRDSARIARHADAMSADGRPRPHGRVLNRSQTLAVSVRQASPSQGHGQRLLAALELAWAIIRDHHAEIPEVVVLIGTGSGRGGVLRKLGHFAARRWRLAGGGERSEILVAGEGLDRGPDMVFATLLHEAAHALAFARGIRDTSHGGATTTVGLRRWPPNSACRSAPCDPTASRRPPCSQQPTPCIRPRCAS